MQVASQKILSLFIKNGADIYGANGSLTLTVVAARTDMTSAARTLALFGVPIDPHKPGFPTRVPPTSSIRDECEEISLKCLLVSMDTYFSQIANGDSSCASLANIAIIIYSQ